VKAGPDRITDFPGATSFLMQVFGLESYFVGLILNEAAIPCDGRNFCVLLVSKGNRYRFAIGQSTIRSQKQP